MNESDIIQDYYAYLKQVHRKLAPATYVEIGIRKGESMLLASPETQVIGIDPQPQITGNLPKNFAIYPVTSDLFFQKYDLQKELNDLALDLAFIDGMHLFEYVLSDFINIEKNADTSTIVLIHDCLPIDAVTSQRERESNVWTGDVWKITFCLLKYRPDLRISLMDAKPSGLAMISNLDPDNSLLEKQKETIKNKYIPLDFTYYEKNGDRIQPLIKNLDSAIACHSSSSRPSSRFNAPATINDFMEEVIRYIENNNTKEALVFYDEFRKNFPYIEEVTRFDTLIDQVRSKQK